MGKKYTHHELLTEIKQLKEENKSLKKKNIDNERDLAKSNEKLEMFFKRSLLGFFFMMLDEPIEWNANTDKEKALDYIFDHQRITKINQAMLNQYGAKEEDFLGLTPNDFFEHDLKHGRKIWKEFLDKGHLKVDTNEQKFDGTKMQIEGDYICFYDEQGRITGHFGVQQDVAEKRIIENTFKNLYDNAPFAYQSIDDAGCFLKVNKKWCEETGYTTNEIIGKKFSDILTPESKKKQKIFLQNLLQNSNNNKTILEIITKSGNKIFAEYESSFTKDANTPFLFSNCVFKNVTSELEAEKKIKENEVNFKTFFNSIDSYLFVLDEKANIIDVNNAVIKKLGYSANELIGKSVLTVHPEDRREEAGQIVREMLQGTRNYCPIPLQTKERQLIQVETHITKGEWNGKLALFGISKDVSELKASEEKFSKAFNNSPIIKGFSDIETGKYTEVNSAFCDKLELTKEETIGTSVTDLIKMDPVFRKKSIEQLKISGKVRNLEAIIKTYKGKELNVLLSADIINIHGKDYNFTTAVDITEQKASEAELKVQKQRLNDIIEGTNVGTWEWNVQTGETIFNERWAQIIGYTLNELKPINIETWTKFAHPDDLKQSAEMLEKHFKGEIDFYEIECRMKHKNGSWVWVFARGKVTKWDNQGKPLWMYGTHHDITDRKIAEEKLQQRETLLSALYKTLPHIIWLKDTSGVYLSCNPRFEDFFGAKEEDIIGKTDYDFVDKKQADFFREKDKAALEAGKPSINEEQVTFASDGHSELLETVKTPLYDFDGNLIGVLGTAYDITERKQSEIALREAKESAEESESRLRAYINSIPDIVCYKDGKGRWLLANNADLELFQLEKVDYIGKTDAELAEFTNPIYKNSFLTCQDSDEKAWQKKTISKGIEIIPTINNDEKIYEVYKIPIFYKNGQRKGLAVIGRDITELQSTQKELIIAKEKAEESNLLKSAFLANMSHEIRTPMNAIVGFAGFLKDRRKSREEIDKFSDIILSSGNHLLHLINNIIDISKIDAGQANIFIEEAQLNKILQGIYNLFHSELMTTGKYNIQLFKNLPKNELHIKTDITRLRQILINLLGNALKFTEKGFVEFGYTVREKEILFFVKDTGIGISEEKQKNIFDRFTQANDYTEKNYGGTGLGLSIAKACAELLGGKIWCQSYAGKGSTFFFTIELNECSPKIKKEKAQAQTINFNGEHILVAEDDDVNYKYIYEILVSNNLKVSRTVTGTDTIKKISENNDIKLILMDIQMPSKNGWEATKEIRKNGIEIPIIAQTAYAYEVDRQKSLEAGCDEYIPKPIKQEKLLKILYSFLYEKK